MAQLAAVHGFTIVAAYAALRSLRGLRPWKPAYPVVLLGLALEAFGVGLHWTRELNLSQGRPGDMFGVDLLVASALITLGWVVWITGLRPRASYRTGAVVSVISHAVMGVVVHIVASAWQLPVDDRHGPILADVAAVMGSLVFWPLHLGTMTGMLSNSTG